MSALVKRSILKAMADRQLVVSPIICGSQLGASSIDLRLGNVFLMVRARGLSDVDPGRFAHPDNTAGDHAFQQARRQKHERYEAPFRQKFLLHPGMLALVPTLEWIKLPANLQGIVTARSSWAREGLSIATGKPHTSRLQGRCHAGTCEPRADTFEFVSRATDSADCVLHAHRGRSAQRHGQPLRYGV